MQKFNLALLALIFLSVCGVRAADNTVRLDGKRFILAEDDKLLQRIITTVLCSFGLQLVASVSDGQALIDVFSKNNFQGCDIIVTDHEMPPGMFGLEAVQKLRENGVELPIVMYSGKLGTDALTEEKMRDAGVDAWQNKPAKKEDLMGALLRAFSARAAKKDSDFSDEAGN